MPSTITQDSSAPASLPHTSPQQQDKHQDEQQYEQQQCDQNGQNNPQTTSIAATTTPFPPHSLLTPDNIDEFINSAPLNMLLHLLGGWAREFGISPKLISSQVIALIGAITKLDLHKWLTMWDDGGVMLNSILTRLPLKSLVYIDLSECSLGGSIGTPILTTIGSSPVLNNLTTLKLSGCGLFTITPLLSGPNTFPYLTVLDLSYNNCIKISELGTAKFANLQELNLSNTTPLLSEESTETIKLPLKHVTWEVSKSNGRAVATLADALSPSTLAAIESLTFGVGAIDHTTMTALINGACPRLTSLRIAECEPSSFIAFCKSPASASITELSLDWADWFDAECLAAIASSPFAPRLKTLSLPFLPISIEPLLSSLNNNNETKLKTFDLSHSKLPLSDFDLIASSPCLATLDVLKLSQVRILPPASGTENIGDSDEQRQINRDSALAKLAASPTTLSHLTHLSLDSLYLNPFSKASLTNLLTSPNLSNKLVFLRLPSLNKDTDGKDDDIVNNDSTGDHDDKKESTGDDIGVILGTQPCSLFHNSGTNFALTNNNVDTNTNGSTHHHLKFGRLQHLEAENCNIGPLGAKAIANNLSALTHLNLSDNLIGDTGLATIVGPNLDFSSLCNIFPCLPNLLSLSVDRCLIGDAGLIALSKSPVLEQLENLHISDHSATSVGVLALLNSARLTHLRSLITSWPPNTMLHLKEEQMSKHRLQNRDLRW